MTEITHLIPMEDFVLQQDKESVLEPLFVRCVNYAQLLKQPPTLDMFVPCDADGKPMSEPKDYIPECSAYTEAKQNCLFEGFKVMKINEFYTVSSEIVDENEISYGFVSLFWKRQDAWELSKGIITLSNLTKFNLPLSQNALNKIYNNL